MNWMQEQQNLESKKSQIFDVSIPNVISLSIQSICNYKEE